MAKSKSPGKGGVTPKKADGKGKPTTAEHQQHDKKVHYEFGGPLGATFIPVLLINTIFGLYLMANENFSLTLSGDFAKQYEKFLNQPAMQALTFKNLFTVDAFAVCIAWFLYHVVLERVLPCDKVEGTKLRDGTKLKYNVNGHLDFWFTLVVLLVGYPQIKDDGNVQFNSFPLEWIYDNYIQLAVAASVLSTLLSIYLYVKSYAKHAMLAEGGDTGNVIYDWFIGRELNPREGDFDWKEFCELRPGLIGWVVINVGCAVAQYRMKKYVSIPMILINLFQGYYVWDALYSEAAILTTMDITTDGFGFMLAFGDLAWVPFTYTLQARYLVENSSPLPTWFWALVFGMKVLGFTIFRGANGEKDRFRTDPTQESVKHIKYIDTKRGTKLMITGWWGMARKINYTGDLLMGLSWCLTTGFRTPVTYFYFIYFAILLIHRALRDDEACVKKYGEEDWNRYKKAVPYMFIPGVF